MTCREAESLVIPFIHEELDDGTAAEFLDHIDACDNCREELEIYYTVEAGIRQLSDDMGSSNIKGEMEADIQAARRRIFRGTVLEVARYAADTLAVLGIFAMLILQFRLWWQAGLF